MTKKILLTASLLLPLIAMSGATYAAGGGGGLSPVFQRPAQSQNQAGPSVASKPYAQYVAPKTRLHWTGPKHNQFHTQRY
jgi:hypothetical protein